MAAAPIIVGALAGGGVGYAAAGALALGTAGTAIATATGAVVGASLMAPSAPTAPQAVVSDVPVVETPETDPTEVNTTGETGDADTTINDVVAVQEEIAEQAETSVQPEVDETAVGTEVETPGGGGTITSVDTDTQEVIVDVNKGLTTSGGVQTGGPTSTNVGTAAGGTAQAVAASTVSTGPAEDEAIDFYEKGRRSTILTTPQGIVDTAAGLLSESGSSLLRPRRGLLA